MFWATEKENWKKNQKQKQKNNKVNRGGSWAIEGWGTVACGFCVTARDSSWLSARSRGVRISNVNDASAAAHTEVDGSHGAEDDDGQGGSHKAAYPCVCIQYQNNSPGGLKTKLQRRPVWLRRLAQVQKVAGAA